MSVYLKTILDGTYCQPIHVGDLNACKDQGQASSDSRIPRNRNPYPDHSAENRWWDFGWTNSFKVMWRIKTMLGKEIEFQDEGIGVIADETEDSIYIVSGFFTGWMYKAEYFELLGTE